MQDSPRRELLRVPLTVAVFAMVAIRCAVEQQISTSRGRAAQRGSGTVETIGWIGIAIVVVGLVGAIVRTKLTNLANSLPDTLNW